VNLEKNLDRLTKEFEQHTKQDLVNFSEIRESIAGLEASTKLLIKFASILTVPMFFMIFGVFLKVFLGIAI